MIMSKSISFPSLLPQSPPLLSTLRCPFLSYHHRTNNSHSLLYPLQHNISFRRNSNEPKKEAAFLDENGAVVEDMDGYLNKLSLEYDSVWDTKPSWCQPWTIALTGVTAVAISWLILHSVVVTALVSSLICAWWYIFLYSYPKAYSDMIAERRRQVTDGIEDTFGLRKPQ